MTKNLRNRILGNRYQVFKRENVKTSRLEWWKSIAAIASSLAIPFVLAIVGYFIQRQLSSDGLKKDYVSIAAGILKENSANQEPDLRKWAVDVLEQNSPVPFTQKAIKGLEKGGVVISAGPPIVPPSVDCLAPRKARTMPVVLEKVLKELQRARKNNDVNAEMDALRKALIATADQEGEAAHVLICLKYMQDWAQTTMKYDDQYRADIGAKSSKEELEEAKARAARAAAATASAAKSSP